MTNTVFHFEKYGGKKQLAVGQKVECVYYREYSTEPNEYHSSLIRRLFDKPFKPVKCGIITGDAGIHPYWLSITGKEQYLYVRFKEYLFKKAIPISCIMDAKEAAESYKSFLEKYKHRIGEKGFSESAFNKLSRYMEKAFEFVDN